MQIKKAGLVQPGFFADNYTCIRWQQLFNEHHLLGNVETAGFDSVEVNTCA
jgi:hypothetical protein